MKQRDSKLQEKWARYAAEWRDPAQVASQWREAAGLDHKLVECHASRGWWELVEELGITLLITREYEHLLIAASAPGGKPLLSYFALPHPSGLAVDRTRRCVYVASTRNPNQVYTLKPAGAMLDRLDMEHPAPEGAPLVPVAAAYYPGCMYLHDLAIIGGQLHGNAVGHNAVVALGAEGCFDRVWWPLCAEIDGQPVFGRNHLQLNSIAAGDTVEESYFSASSTSIGRLRPGHLNYPVDRRGVIFSGLTRVPVCTGLTRPHSARLRGAEIWVANSGYGELGFVSDGKLQVVTRLPGWTRGLCLIQDIAFVATSRVIPKFTRYAPGLDVPGSRCAVHAISMKTGNILATLEWPSGNQVFAIDWISNQDSHGFPFRTGARNRKRETGFFYSYLAR